MDETKPKKVTYHAVGEKLPLTDEMLDRAVRQIVEAEIRANRFEALTLDKLQARLAGMERDRLERVLEEYRTDRSSKIPLDTGGHTRRIFKEGVRITKNRRTYEH